MLLHQPGGDAARRSDFLDLDGQCLERQGGEDKGGERGEDADHWTTSGAGMVSGSDTAAGSGSTAGSTAVSAPATASGCVR